MKVVFFVTQSCQGPPNAAAKKLSRSHSVSSLLHRSLARVHPSNEFRATKRGKEGPKIRVMVKRILNKYGYPPDLQEDAVNTELQQGELLCSE